MRAEIVNPFLEAAEAADPYGFVIASRFPELLVPMYAAMLANDSEEAFVNLSNDELIVALCFMAVMLDEGDVVL